MKKILILGMGNAQRDIIEYCREKGFFVYGVSNASGDPAEKLVDESSMIDILYVKGLTEFAEKKKVDYVYSVGTDVAMPSVAEVSKSLKLPCFFEKWTASVCNHKHQLRKILGQDIAGNIPYQIIGNSDEKISLNFPLMMKPSDSQGQRGVRKVDNTEDLKKYFTDTIGFSREKKVILEPFIDGDEISVNVFMENGIIKFYLISDRKTWDEYPGGIIHEHVIPSRYEDNPEITKKVRDLVSCTLEAIKLKNGPAYFQIKISTSGNPYLIEVTPRLDGCHMWRLIKYATGVNLLEASVDLLSGNTYRQTRALHTQPCSLEFLCGKPESVFQKSHFKLPEHVALQWFYEDGQIVRPMNRYYEKCGYIIKKGG